MQKVTVEQLKTLTKDEEWADAWVTAEGDQINVSVHRPSGNCYRLEVVTPWHSGEEEYTSAHAVRGAIMALPD